MSSYHTVNRAKKGFSDPLPTRVEGAITDKMIKKIKLREVYEVDTESGVNGTIKCGMFYLRCHKYHIYSTQS